MAGGQDHAGIRAEFAHGEGQLRRRARSFKQIGVTAEVRADLGAELGEIPREMPRVMREHQRGLAIASGELFRVGDQAADGAADVVEIHGRGPDTRMFRPVVRTALTLLRRRHHAPDRAPAQSAGAEGERFEEPVVEFLPGSARDQFVDGFGSHFTRGASEQREDVAFGRFEKFPFGNSG